MFNLKIKGPIRETIDAIAAAISLEVRPCEHFLQIIVVDATEVIVTTDRSQFRDALQTAFSTTKKKSTRKLSKSSLRLHRS